MTGLGGGRGSGRDRRRAAGGALGAGRVKQALSLRYKWLQMPYRADITEIKPLAQKVAELLPVITRR